jgi:1-acyl-sn-glycerol-3-phosphate acyltransferase
MRAARIVLHVMQGLAIAALIFPFCSTTTRDFLIRSWSRKIVSIFNVRIHVHAGPPAANIKGAVFAANHVSWLDVWVIDSQHACRFIAKSEVRGWPVVGWLAAKTGTLFIERERKRHAAILNKEVAAVLATGDCIAVFPEGTTTDGRQLKRFFGTLLQPAADSGAPLIPVAIRYVGDDGEIDLTPAFIDDMTLIESLRRMLHARRTRVEIAFLPAIDTRGKTRREIAYAAQEAIAAALSLPSPGSAPETAPDPQDA